MALARVALKNLQQRACSQVPALGRISLLHPHSGVQGQGRSYGLLQRFSAASSGSEGGKEVAVQSSDQGGRRSRWRSLLPRRLRRPSLWRRKETPRDPFDIFPAPGIGNALLEAAENMNRLFENIAPTQIMGAPSQMIGRFRETNDSYKLRYDVPGLTKDELKVTVDDGMLRIRGERKVEDEDEDDDEYWTSYGYYDARLVLPDDAKQDDIKAELKDGVLNITIPKAESQGKDVKEVQIH